MCFPVLSFLVFTLNGLVQALKAPLSTWHSNVAPAVEEPKVNVAFSPLVTFLGPAILSVSGAGSETLSQLVTASARSAVTESVPAAAVHDVPDSVPHVDAVVALAAVHRVGAAARVERVVAGAAVDVVGAGATQERVVAAQSSERQAPGVGDGCPCCRARAPRSS